MGTSRRRIATIVFAIVVTGAAAIALYALPQCLSAQCRLGDHSDERVCTTICLANPFVVYRFELLVAVVVLCVLVVGWVLWGKKSARAA